MSNAGTNTVSAGTEGIVNKMNVSTCRLPSGLVFDACYLYLPCAKVSTGWERERARGRERVKVCVSESKSESESESESESDSESDLEAGGPGSADT